MKCAALFGVFLGVAMVAAAADEPRELLFVSNRDGNAQIYAMKADGSGQRPLTTGPAENTEPVWSPDGKRIAYTSYRDGNAEIYVMQSGGEGQTRLTHHAAADNLPAWTPDGRIVFRSMRDRWANFYVMNADGSGLATMTSDESDKGGPVLSPDGRWIAWVAHSVSGSSDIHVMPTRGGPAKNLTGELSKAAKSYPSWSPDSRRIAYVEAQGVALNVKVIDPDGSRSGKITDNAYTNAFPIWSPDGKRIAFVSSREGTRTEMARGDIYVMNADGSGATNLTRHPDEDNYPAWSGDGTAIYFVSLRDGKAQIYAISPQGGEARRLTRSNGHDLMIRPLPLPPAAGALANASMRATSAQNTQ